MLIGKKTDPFCFSVIPSNDSIGDLCYRPDYGAQYYDLTRDGPGAMRYAAAASRAPSSLPLLLTRARSLARAHRSFDLNSKTPVGNITSTILAADVEFWIVNKFPWYAAGVHQCICTNVHDGVGA